MESYEQKYKEALKRASKLKVQNPFDTVGQMVEHIFPEIQEPEIQESEDEKIRKALIEGLRTIKKSSFYTISSIKIDNAIAWIEKQGEKKSADEVLKIRRKAYSDGYKHGQDNIAIFLGKESIEALEHFVRSIGESGYASPYDNRTKLVYRLLEQLKQIVK